MYLREHLGKVHRVVKELDVDEALLTEREKERVSEILRLPSGPTDSWQLPEEFRQWHRKTRNTHLLIGACAIVPVATVAGILSGTGGSGAVSLFVVFSILFSAFCLQAVVFQIQADHAAKRFATAVRQRQASDYLLSIGYFERTQPPSLAAHSGDPSYQPHWHVDGYDHSRHRGLFSSADRARMNEYGMDADTYLNNVLENDRD